MLFAWLGTLAFAAVAAIALQGHALWHVLAAASLGAAFFVFERPTP